MTMGGLPLVLVAAAAARLFALLQVWDHPLVRVPLLDAELYASWAQGFLHGAVPTSQLYPGYGLFLAGLQGAFGPSLAPVLIAQALLGVWTCGLIWSVTRRVADGASGGAVHPPVVAIGGERAALCAGLLAAAYVPSLVYEAHRVNATLLLWLTAVALWAIVRSRPVLAGLVLAAGVSVRPTTFLISVALSAWMWRRGARRGSALVLGLSGVALAAMLLRAAPATLGPNLYIGNGPGADGTYRHQPFERPHPRYQAEDFHAEAARRLTQRGQSLTYNILGSGRFWVGETLRAVKESPGAWLHLVSRKAWIAIGGGEVPVNLNPRLFRVEAGGLFASPLPTFGLLMALAAAGWSAFFGLVGIACLAPLVIFFVSGEYRHPAAAAFLPMAGIGMSRLMAAGRLGWNCPRPAVRRVAVPILLAGAVTASAPAPVVSWRALYNAGNAYLASGRDADAARLFGRCAEVAPAFPEAHFYRGLALAHERDYAGAAEAYARALSLRPRWARAWNSLGVARGASGDPLGAHAAFRQALAIEPSNAEAAWNLRMLARVASPATARRHPGGGTP